MLQFSYVFLLLQLWLLSQLLSLFAGAEQCQSYSSTKAWRCCLPWYGWYGVRSPAVNNYIFGGGLRARLRHKRISSLKHFRIPLKDFYLGSWYWYGSTEMSKPCPKIHLQKHEKQKGVDRSPGNFRQKKQEVSAISSAQRAQSTKVSLKVFGRYRRKCLYSMDWFKGKSTGNHRFSH